MPIDPSMTKGAIPAPAGVVPNFADPEDVLHTVNLVAQILAIILFTPVVGLRLWVRWRVTPPFLIDDCMCYTETDSSLHWESS